MLRSLVKTRRARQHVIAAGAVCVLALPLPAFSATYRITPDGPRPQAVIDRAAAGDRIAFAKGRYRVNLLLTKPIVLAGDDGAVLDGGGVDDVVRVRAPGVTLRGFTIRGAGRNLTQMNAGVFVERAATNTRIEDNFIQASGFGIWLDGCRGTRVLRNRIHGNPAIRSQDRGNGIHLFNVQGVEIAGNEIWQTRDGIYIDTSTDNVLRDNDMHDLRYGVHYMYSYSNKVIGNRTHDTRTGYALMQSKYLTVVGNRSEHDVNYGILMNYIIDSVIADNRVIGVRHGSGYVTGGELVVGAEGKALFVYNSLFNDFHDNLFADSDIGIHLTAGSDDNLFYDNAFVNNYTQVKYVASREQEWSRDGRGNYWSDYLGWDRNGDGIGDMPYEPNDAIDRLLWKYPLARILMHSPAVETLRWVQTEFPVLRPPGVRDSFPLLKPPVPLTG